MIGNETLENLSKLIRQSTTLKRLLLRSNLIQSAGLISFCSNGLQHNRSIQELDLVDNSYDHQAVKVLTRMMLKSNRFFPIQILRIDIDLQCGKYLKRLLSKHENLVELELFFVINDTNPAKPRNFFTKLFRTSSSLMSDLSDGIAENNEIKKLVLGSRSLSLQNANFISFFEHLKRVNKISTIQLKFEQSNENEQISLTNEEEQTQLKNLASIIIDKIQQFYTIRQLFSQIDLEIYMSEKQQVQFKHLLQRLEFIFLFFFFAKLSMKKKNY